MTAASTVNIIIAGGKTGGHLFPGIAVAQALQRLHAQTDILFVGTDAPFEKRTLKIYGFSHRSISARPLKGGSLFAKAVSVGMLGISLIQAAAILRSFKPAYVLGVGGFSSFAVVLAAWMLRIPSGIQEQNAIPGMTNRMLKNFTGAIFTSFEHTRGFSKMGKTIYTGNPVRKSSTPGAAIFDDMPEIDPGKPTLLVTGGSQGAASINTAVLDALSLMKNPGRFNIIHQTGKNDESKATAFYTKNGIAATARAFFHCMPRIQDAADLIISRSGAGILSEICTKGLAAILVPYPHAADNHQYHNARALADAGAAVLIQDKELDGKKLKQTIEDLIENRDKSIKMARNARNFARLNADETIAAHILNTKGIKG